MRNQDSVQIGSIHEPLAFLADYYSYLYDLAKGYVKVEHQRKEQLAIVKGRQMDVEDLDRTLNIAKT